MSAPNDAETLVTSSAYAARIGVSKARVSQLIARGMPCVPDGRAKMIDVAKADAWRAANLEPKVRDGQIRGLVETDPASPASAFAPPPATSSPDPGSTVERIQAARAATYEADARRAMMRELKDARLLVDRAAAVAIQRAFVAQVSTQIERMPQDSAATVAAALGVSEHAAYIALRDVADRMREDLARHARDERDRAVGGPGGGRPLGGDGQGGGAEAAA